VKAEHVNAIVSFIRRLRPVDLLLPAGAALVSVGVQQLVDREDRQRRRLAALQELVDVHRGALVDAGVSLPAELVDDELHPLDVDGALQIALARTPSDDADNRITGNGNPEKAPSRRRTARRFAVLGLAGAAGATMWARGYARTYGQEPTVLGFLTALRGPVEVAREETSSNSYPDNGGTSSVVAEHEHRYASDLDSVCEICGEKSRPSPADAPTLGHEGSDRWTGGDRKDEGVIGHGEPPLEECGWPNCDWTSDATRSELSQRTAAAVHRNRCIYRPAGAAVPGA
jgi:hypothetical protein